MLLRAHWDLSGTDVLPFDADTVVQSLGEQAKAVLATMYDFYKSDLADLTRAVIDWCPPWQPYANTLLETPVMQKALMTNSHVPQLCQAAHTLQEMVKHTKALNYDGYDKFIDAKAIADAASAKSLAVETVGVAWALDRWFNAIKVQPNHIIRCKIIAGLRQDLRTRSCTVPTDLDAQLKLAASTDFQVEGDVAVGSKRPAQSQPGTPAKRR